MAGSKSLEVAALLDIMGKFYDFLGTLSDKNGSVDNQFATKAEEYRSRAKTIREALSSRSNTTK